MNGNVTSLARPAWTMNEDVWPVFKYKSIGMSGLAKWDLVRAARLLTSEPAKTDYLGF